RLEENVIRPSTKLSLQVDSMLLNQSSFTDMPFRMTEQVGIIRTGTGIHEFVNDYPLHPINLSNYTNQKISYIHRYTASSLIATSALLRTESRGGHYRHDYPTSAEEWTGKVIEQSIQGVSISTRKIERKETVK
ncbi:MAG TPA: L-aspartate oxidase, partial [Paenisporosarcina sp.]|nr:L-aspartate oxidase [Paenisporosarcina sp.]